MKELSMVVAENVQRLRKDNDWSQKDLAYALKNLGGEWSRQSLGMLESKGIRAERLSDLVLICAAFGVALDELLEGDGDVALRGGGTRSLDWSRNALRGACGNSRPPAGSTRTALGIGADDPEEVRRMAARWSLSVEDLRRTVREYSGQDSPTAYRDYLAGLAPHMTREEARTRRGQGTRKLALLFVPKSSEDDVPERDQLGFFRWFEMIQEAADGDD